MSKEMSQPKTEPSMDTAKNDGPVSRRGHMQYSTLPVLFSSAIIHLLPLVHSGVVSKYESGFRV